MGNTARRQYDILDEILGGESNTPEYDLDAEKDGDLRNDYILYCEGKRVDRDPREFQKYMPKLRGNHDPM